MNNIERALFIFTAIVIGSLLAFTIVLIIEMKQENAIDPVETSTDEKYISEVHRQFAAQLCSEEAWKKILQLSEISKAALDQADEQSVESIKQSDPMAAMMGGLSSIRFNDSWITANTELSAIAVRCTLLRAHGKI